MVLEGQIFRIHWQNSFNPQMDIRTDKKIESVPLFDEKIDWTLGEKYCIGYWKNKYHECPTNSKISYGSKCKTCKELDEYFKCVQCDGSKCLNAMKRESCRKDNFFIYLVAFNSLLKVGITRNFRFRLRVIEQGADFAAKICSITDGRKARKIEQEISKSLMITDRVRGNQKLNHLFSDPNLSLEKINKSIEKLRENKFTILNNPEIYDLRKYYKLENIDSMPMMLNNLKDKNLKGKIISLKGNILVLKNSENYAVNTHDLIGRKIQVKQV